MFSAPVSGANAKRQNTISYKQLTKEITIYRGGSKCFIAKRSKITSNINQLIKSTAFVARLTKRGSVAQGLF